jgi:hypothetical protein
MRRSLVIALLAALWVMGPAVAQQFDPSNPFQPMPENAPPPPTPGPAPGPAPGPVPPGPGEPQGKLPGASPGGVPPGGSAEEWGQRPPPGRLVGNGSGFAINGQGHVVTNYHVVEDCRALGNPDLGTFTLIGTDPNTDLAVLLAERAPTATLSLRQDGEVRLGDEIIVLGFPLQQYLAPQLNLTQGIVSSLAGLGGDIRLLQITAPVQPGNSGGPLLDMAGNVGGVVVSRLDALRVASETGSLPENVNFAIKVGELRRFLDSNGVSYATRASEAVETAADLAELYAEAVVVVECYQ